MPWRASTVTADSQRSSRQTCTTASFGRRQGTGSTIRCVAYYTTQYKILHFYSRTCSRSKSRKRLLLLSLWTALATGMFFYIYCLSMLKNTSVLVYITSLYILHPHSDTLTHQSDVWSSIALLPWVAASSCWLWRAASQWAERRSHWTYTSPSIPTGRRAYLLPRGPGVCMCCVCMLWMIMLDSFVLELVLRWSLWFLL